MFSHRKYSFFCVHYIYVQLHMCAFTFVSFQKLTSNPQCVCLFSIKKETIWEKTAAQSSSTQYSLNHLGGIWVTKFHNICLGKVINCRSDTAHSISLLNKTVIVHKCRNISIGVTLRFVYAITTVLTAFYYQI